MNEPTERPAPDASPDEIAAWIDTFDTPQAPAETTEGVLEAQRTDHVAATPAPPPADDGTAPLVNNVGDDGGAASG